MGWKSFFRFGRRGVRGGEHDTLPTDAPPADPLDSPAHAVITRTNGQEEVLVFDERLMRANLAAVQATLSLAAGHHEEALARFQSGLRDIERHPGPDDPQTVSCLCSLASVAAALSEEGAVARLCDRARTAPGRSKMADPDGYASALARYGEILENRGEFLRARDVLTEALQYTQDVEVNHLLGVACSHLGDDGEAEALFRRSLAGRTGSGEEDRLGAALSLDGLAKTLLRLGRPEEALTAAHQACEIRIEVQGYDGPDVARALDTLAIAHKSLHDLRGAEVLQRRAVALYERLVGADQAETGIALGNLAGTLLQMGQRTEAIILLSRALAIKERGAGSDHPTVAHTLHNLAAILAEEGKFETAKALAERAWRIRLNRLGLRHPDTIQSQSLLSQITADLEFYSKIAE